MGHAIPPPRISLCPLSLMQACTIILVSCFNPSSVAAPMPPPVFGNITDHHALLSFKSMITSDPFGALASWNGSLHFCHWHGITCSGRRHPQRVVALDLENLNLVGTLSPSLANLTFLRRLHLPNNNLGGRLLPELGGLLRLQHINLTSNSLSGGIPANLSRCVNLRNLTIGKNRIAGEIPKELGYLARLQRLSLLQNMITGRIPSSMGNLSSVFSFNLGDNRLKGSIPTELVSLDRLQNLILGINRLSGSIPSNLYNSSSLRWIHLGDNKLSGTLPPNLGCGLPQLKYFSMYSNQLGGHLPLSFPNASHLLRIELHFNSFTGVIPSNFGALQDLSWLHLSYNQLEAADWSFLGSLTNCSRLQMLILHNNKLQGTLPATVANLSTQLQWLTIAGNRISGGIPRDIWKLINLAAVNMADNLLTGDIPNAIGSLGGLTKLSLSGNKLTGKVPSSLGNLTRLAKLWLNDNDLEGRIPASFRNYQFLGLLDLSHNRLSGEITREAIGLRSLSEYLSLSHNLLTGSLPMEVSNLKNLLELDISDNKLSGEIPASLGDCQILEYLNMEGNSFQGSIPASLSKLKGLQVLDLSRNQFSGAIPEFLSSIPLQLLNLSFNDFEGEVPKGGIFQNYSAYTVLGNPKLCGGHPKLHLPTCHVQAYKKKHGPPELTIVIPILTCLVLCLVFVFVFRRNRQILNSKENSPPLNSLGDVQYTRVSYGQLFKATAGFSTENLLGKGSFGSVYKGILDEGAKLVAVKVLNLQQHGASKSFMTECEALRKVRHRNLLKILTTCSSLDFEGNEFKALVFEFMPNGSLENWLHPEECASSLSNKLNFTQRLNIAIDVASSLDYLHNHGETPIVHRDLKPSNILLDYDMCAHVGDFGLSKFTPQKGYESSKCHSSSVGIKGSIGYIAPEYGVGSQPSTLGDIYSYGILLLEMFTGKRPTNELFQEGLSLHNYVELAFPARVMNIIDPYLFSYGGHGADGNIQGTNNIKERLQKCLALVIKVGLLCSKESPAERLKMKDVIKELSIIRDLFFGVKTYCK